MKNLLSLITSTACSTDGKCKIPHVRQAEYVFAEKETTPHQWSHPFHWHKNNSQFVLEWDTPGLTPHDLKFVVQQRILIIPNKTGTYPAWQPSPERKHTCHFTQSIRLPRYVFYHKGEARYQFGKLIFSFPTTSQSLSHRFKSTWLSHTQALSTKPEMPR